MHWYDRGTMHWYNPRTRCEETVPAPSTDQDALGMLRGDLDSGVFVSQYRRLRREGLSVQRAMVLVGDESQLRHLRYRAAS